MPTDSEMVLRRLIDEGFSEGRLEVCDEIVAPTMVEHQPFGPDHPDGPDGVKAVITSLRTPFADFRLTVEDVAVAGDVVWSRNVATGRHEDLFMGHPATGRSFRIDVVDIMRVQHGQIVEHWGVPDRLGVLIQLGLIARPGQPPPSAG